MNGDTRHLPDAITLADAWDEMPPLAPELIPNILREGHKMLLADYMEGGRETSGEVVQKQEGQAE